MDYIDFQVRRIADDLRRAGVSVPGNASAPTTINEPQQESEFTIARGHKSTIYLPRWIQDHCNDPALMASSFVFVMHFGNSNTLMLPGFYGPFALPPS